MDVRPVRLFHGANHDARIAISRLLSARLGNGLHHSRKELGAEFASTPSRDAECNGTRIDIDDCASETRARHVEFATDVTAHSADCPRCDHSCDSRFAHDAISRHESSTCIAARGIARADDSFADDLATGDHAAEY